jgi:hypothetical protein
MRRQRRARNLFRPGEYAVAVHDTLDIATGEIEINRGDRFLVLAVNPGGSLTVGPDEDSPWSSVAEIYVAAEDFSPSRTAGSRTP